MLFTSSTNQNSSSAVISKNGKWLGRPMQRELNPASIGLNDVSGTGYSELDLHLQNRSWIFNALTEVIIDRPNIGELQLFMPIAVQLTKKSRWFTMINPPFKPIPQSMVAQGVKLDQVMILRNDSTTIISTCEKILGTGRCGALLVWIDAIEPDQLERLNVAASNSGSMVVIFRNRRTLPINNAQLRLQVGKSDGHTVISVKNGRSNAAQCPIKLDLNNALTERFRTAYVERLLH